MARTYYYVVKNGLNWDVKTEGRQEPHQTFRTQADAIEFARGEAQFLWNQYRRPSGVRIQGRDNLWQDERTYGEDPFPPHG
jgi:Uncharacterized protein conserved in bacteria (DUF2188)